MMNNEELSRLQINFKELSQHPAEYLLLNSNGFLITTDIPQEPINAKVKQCIDKTYASLVSLLQYHPRQLAETDLDFDLYKVVIDTLMEWSQKKHYFGLETKNKGPLIGFLSSLNNYAAEIKEKEAVRQEKIIQASSCKELFALKNDRKKKRQNIIVILTDEEKALSSYESKAVKEFHDKELLASKKLRENGITITNFQCSSAACTPARTVTFTGHLPDLSKTGQTNGVGKTDQHPKIRNLSPQIPTIGSYFNAAGYDTCYKGKWHLSDGNIHRDVNGILQAIISKKVNEPRDKAVEAEYLQANPLKPYGFDGWIGREPHGSSPNDCGFNRDSTYIAQAKEWLLERHNDKNNHKPFFLTISLVQPHDYVFPPVAWLYFVYKFRFPLPGKDIYSIPTTLPPSMGDNLDDRPSVQKEYREQYARAFGAKFMNGTYNGPLKEYNPFNIWYQKIYLFFEKLADDSIKELLDFLEETGLGEDTWVIKSSDHGDQKGARGLAQKWHTADEETTKIPLNFYHPRLEKKGVYEGLVSQVDFLPTVLSIAGLDPVELQEILKKTHSEVHPFVGKPIGDRDPKHELDTEKVQICDSAFFFTRDNPFDGDDQRSLLAQMYDIPSWIAPKFERIAGNKIMSIKAYLDIEGKRCYYKYSVFTSKDPKNSSEEILIDLKNDPYERKNKIHDKRRSKKDELALPILRQLLDSEAKKQLIKPYNPQTIINAQTKRPHVSREKPDWDFLIFLLTPPLLVLLVIAGIAYTQRHRIVEAAPVITGGLALWGLYRHCTRKTPSNEKNENTLENNQPQPGSP